MLKSGEIDGFVLDRYTFVLYYRNCKSDGVEDLGKEMKDNLEFLETETIRTEKFYKGKDVSYGFLIKNIEDYKYFADFVLDNQNAISTCQLLYINKCSGNHDVFRIKNALFAISDGYFWPSFLVGSITIAIIIIIGLIYELVRKKCVGELFEPNMLLKG